MVEPPGEARSKQEEFAPYAGRWIALLGARVIGQGGTPEQALRAAKAARIKDKPKVFYVPLSTPLVFNELLERVTAALPDELNVFLVGGAVRDAMLGRPVHDLDFVLGGDALQIARRVAKKLEAAFFPLDEERGTARLILRNYEGVNVVLDFAAYRGDDLESDLRGRDFTINAMAVDIRNPGALLDPLGGAVDLRAKQLRVCSANSIQNDPLRILRGVRLAATFDLHILPDTRRLMRRHVSLLPGVSVERLRDELFRILEGPRPAASLRALEMLGVFPHLFPELPKTRGVEQSSPHIFDVWNHTLAVVQNLEEALAALSPEYDPDAAANLSFGLLVLHLGRYRQQIGEHLADSLTPGRSLRALLFLAALYHDVGKPLTREVDETGRIRFFKHDQIGAGLVSSRARALRLSNDEIDRLELIVRHHLRPTLLAQSDRLPTRRAIYRFFRQSGAGGVDVCLLSLADILGTYGPSLPTDKWVRHLDVARSLLEAWWERPEESVAPPAVVNGRDLIDIFSLKPGPKIGELLESVREAQATGKVHDREEALSLIREILNQDESGP